MGLNWKGEVDIREIFIADHHDDTLVFAKSLQTNILSVRNLIKGDLDFGKVDFSDTKLYIKTYLGEEDDNMYVFTQKFETGEPPTDPEPFHLAAGSVSMTDSRVRLIDENQENPEVFDFTDLNLAASNFTIEGPDISAAINSLSLNSSDGYSITNLTADFKYGLEALTLDNLDLKTLGSQIKGNVSLGYGEEGMSDFENNVIITANFKDTEIATDDLNAFYDEFGPGRTVMLNGDFKGTLNDFEFTNANIASGRSTFRGDFNFRNLLKGDNSHVITARNHRIRSNFYDLGRLMPRVMGGVLPKEVERVGNIQFNGTTRLTHTQLVTDGILITDAGYAEVNADLGNINNFDNAIYNGKLKLEGFSLGQLLGSESLGNVSADLTFDGRGFTQETVDTKISGTIPSLHFEGYDYRNITVTGNLKNPVFNGDLSINDPNLEMNFKGLVDVSKEFNQYDFEADVEYAELNQLNLLKRDSISIFSGKIVMDMDGTTVDDAVGTITFRESFYQNEDDDFYFDDFRVISSFTEDEHVIEIQSPDIVSGKIQGQFLIEDLPNLFRNGVGSIYANYIPNEVTVDQYVDYEFEVYNKLIEVFVPQLKLGENTRVRGSVSSDESKFKLDFRSPEIILFDKYLGKVNVQVDNDNPLYNTFVSVDSVYSGVYNVVDVNLINKTLNDTLYIRSEFKGGKEKEDLFNLSLYHTINPQGKSVVGVKRSDITYKDNVWYVNEHNNKHNKVVFDNNFSEVRIDSLVFNHNREIIQMAGVIRDTSYKDLKVRFRDVNIGNITPEVQDLDLKGNVNGNLDFLQQNGAYYPKSSVTVDDVIINDIEFGNLDLQIDGNEDLSKYSIDMSLVNDRITSLSAKGEIDVTTDDPQIDMDVDLSDFNLRAFSPFGGDVITDIRGLASGSAQVTGNYKSPDINGMIWLNETGMNIPYLNTDFDLSNNSTVFVTKNKLELRTTRITDTKYNTFGTLSGNATHDNFGDWALDFHIETDRMLVLDTPPDDDVLYYGTAFISGEADIKGPVDELVIDVIATTEEGTTFTIPLSDAEAIGDDSFIRFISPEEKQARITGETIVSEEIKGLSLNFELDINTNAEVEVVVDKVNNSRLSGKGAGILLIEINTLGKFNMWGDFLVFEGEYDFRYGGIIQKEFTVEPGGSITWDGSPTRARLDLSAKYETQANPSVLLDNPTINRAIPVEVLIDISEEIIQPELDFRIRFPKVSSNVRSELEYKLQDDTQREKQALFLISTGSFVSDAAAGQNAFAGTLAERINSLVADLFSRGDSKFKAVPYFVPGRNTVDQETSTEIGVQLSTQISERILINGRVGVPVGGINESTVAGDIEVQWLVNEDGSLRINFFNRQADIQFVGEDQIFEQGAGVSYSVDFDTVRELIYKLFNRTIEVESEKVAPEQDDNTVPVDPNGDGIKNED